MSLCCVVRRTGEPDGLHFSPAGSTRLGRGLGECTAVREFLLGAGPPEVSSNSGKSPDSSGGGDG